MITPEQREARKQYIGSSDSAAILGIDPWQNRSDVWLSKTGRLPDWEGNEATEVGSACEGAVLDIFEQRHSVKLVRHSFLAEGIFCANLDGAIGIEPGFEAVVEAKTTGNRGAWGEAGTDEVPDHVLVQVHHQMAVVGCDVAWVPALMPGFKSLEVVVYRVERNQDLIDQILEAGTQFWKYVERDIQPVDFHPHIDSLKRMRRIPKSTVEVDEALIAEWLEIKESCIASESNKKEVEARLLAALGDAEAGSCRLGVVTYLEQGRKGYTVEPTKFRVARFKQARGIGTYKSIAEVGGF